MAFGDGDTAPPLHLGLMLDVSGSMQSDLKLAQSAAIKFLNLLPHAEDITLVDFDTQVRITSYPQRDFGYLSDDTTVDGAWRKVEIKVTRPDTRVRARKGYFPPYQTSQN